jgi:AcrR family transcriptional regulator
MFADLGYHATTLRALAARADMTLGTLYHYFPSKEDLLAELIDDAMVPLMDSLPLLEQRQDDDPADVLAWMVRTFLLGTFARLSTAMISETELRALSGTKLQLAVAKRDTYQQAMERVVESGRARGEFHVTDTKLAVYAILAMCSGVPRWYRPEGRLTQDDVAEQFSDLALRLVGFVGAPTRVTAGLAGGDGTRQNL